MGLPEPARRARAVWRRQVGRRPARWVEPLLSRPGRGAATALPAGRLDGRRLISTLYAPWWRRAQRVRTHCEQRAVVRRPRRQLLGMEWLSRVGDVSAAAVGLAGSSSSYSGGSAVTFDGWCDRSVGIRASARQSRAQTPVCCRHPFFFPYLFQPHLEVGALRVRSSPRPGERRSAPSGPIGTDGEERGGLRGSASHTALPCSEPPSNPPALGLGGRRGHTRPPRSGGLAGAVGEGSRGNSVH